jgi:hypothetical protein
MISNRNPNSPVSILLFKVMNSSDDQRKSSSDEKIKNRAKIFLIDPKSAIFGQIPTSLTKIQWTQMKNPSALEIQNETTALTLSNQARPSFLQILTFLNSRMGGGHIFVTVGLPKIKEINFSRSQDFWKSEVMQFVQLSKGRAAYLKALENYSPRSRLSLLPQKLSTRVIACVQGEKLPQTLGDQIINETTKKALETVESTFENLALEGFLMRPCDGVDFEEICPRLAENDPELAALMKSPQGRVAISYHLSKRPSEKTFKDVTGKQVALAIQGATGVDVVGTMRQTLRVAQVSCLVLFIFFCTIYYPLIDTRYHLPSYGSRS